MPDETLIVVTNWDKVDKDDFYLSKEWEDNAGKENIRLARKLQRAGELFYAWVVPASHYVLYSQMDASEIMINSDGDEIISGESAVIDNKHSDKWEYEL